MNLPSLPPAAYVDKKHHDPVYDDLYFTERQMQAYGQACREQALLDAMNATLPYDKVGRVIAAAIGALK